MSSLLGTLKLMFRFSSSLSAVAAIAQRSLLYDYRNDQRKRVLLMREISTTYQLGRDVAIDAIVHLRDRSWKRRGQPSDF
jgi:hypothetical protein